MSDLKAARYRVAAIAALLLGATAVASQSQATSAEKVTSFAVPEARQAVAVDANHFYAIDNRVIGKHDKRTGRRVAEWKGPAAGQIIHLNSGVVIEGKLYAAHSNFPGWPMRSSVEIWDTATLTHIGTHDLGQGPGSLTWLDFQDGVWWGAFANYARFLGSNPFAHKFKAQIVRFDKRWRVAETWTLPAALIARFGAMSNSGGSWGPDGRLWISGHDLPEAYALDVPKAGSVMRWVGTARLDIAGQGIAWDRSDSHILWGVVRDTAMRENRVTAARVNLPEPRRLGAAELTRRSTRDSSRTADPAPPILSARSMSVTGKATR